MPVLLQHRCGRRLAARRRIIAEPYAMPRTGKIGAAQIGTVEVYAVGFADKDRARAVIVHCRRVVGAYNRILKIRIARIAVAQVRAEQLRAAEIGRLEPRSAEIGTFQLRVHKPRPVQMRDAQNHNLGGVRGRCNRKRQR